MYTSARCSGSRLLGGFGGSTEAPTTAAGSGVLPGPKSNSPGDSGGQQLSRAGRLGVSILLNKPALGLGAVMAKLDAGSIFAAVSLSQLPLGETGLPQPGRDGSVLVPSS